MAQTREENKLTSEQQAHKKFQAIYFCSVKQLVETYIDRAESVATYIANEEKQGKTPRKDAATLKFIAQTEFMLEILTAKFRVASEEDLKFAKEFFLQTQQKLEREPERYKGTVCAEVTLLGLALQHGLGIKSNTKAASKCYELAIDYGCVTAPALLANLLIFCTAETHEYDDSERTKIKNLYEMSIKKGSSLGLHFYCGHSSKMGFDQALLEERVLHTADYDFTPAILSIALIFEETGMNSQNQFLSCISQGLIPAYQRILQFGNCTDWGKSYFDLENTIFRIDINPVAVKKFSQSHPAEFVQRLCLNRPRDMSRLLDEETSTTFVKDKSKYKEGMAEILHSFSFSLLKIVNEYVDPDLMLMMLLLNPDYMLTKFNTCKLKSTEEFEAEFKQYSPDFLLTPFFKKAGAATVILRSDATKDLHNRPQTL